MARKLVNIELSEVSLVDSPANPGANILLYKRAEIEKKIVERDGEYCVTSADGSKTLGCHKTMREAKAQLAAVESNKHDPLSKEEIERVLKIAKELGLLTTEKKEKTMAEEFKKESLTPEAKAFVEDLEKRLADSEAKVVETEAKVQELSVVAKKDEPEDIWKGVHPDVKKQFEEMKTRTEESERIAKTERDAREFSEFSKRAETELSHLPGELKTKATILKAVSQKLSKEESEEAIKILKAANELVKTGQVFEEIGTSGGSGSDAGTWAKIEAMAKDLVSKGLAKTQQIAIDKVMTTNPELYNQYLKEQGKKIS
jgi:hypothetical protein